MNRLGNTRAEIQVSTLIAILLVIGIVAFFVNRDFRGLCLAFAGEKSKTSETGDGVWKAVSDGDASAVKEALESNPNLVYTTDSLGMTLLHRAAAKNRFEVARLLVEKGANVNANAGDMGTPLHEAASSGSMLVADFLLSRAADVNAVCSTGVNAGVTPLMWAAAYGHRDVAELLIAHGANVKAGDHNGGTAYQFAEAKNHQDIMALLKDHGALTSDEVINQHLSATLVSDLRSRVASSQAGLQGASSAYKKGVYWGSFNGKEDRNYTRTDHKDLSDGEKVRLAGGEGFRAGSVEYGDFWVGYDDGYRQARYSN
jgi:uncharacterized protein